MAQLLLASAGDSMRYTPRTSNARASISRVCSGPNPVTQCSDELAHRLVRVVLLGVHAMTASQALGHRSTASCWSLETGSVVLVADDQFR